MSLCLSLGKVYSILLIAQHVIFKLAQCLRPRVPCLPGAPEIFITSGIWVIRVKGNLCNFSNDQTQRKCGSSQPSLTLQPPLPLAAISIVPGLGSRTI